MTQLEIYERQLEIAKQLLENAKKNNMGFENVADFESLYDLCKRSIEVYENNKDLFGEECKMGC